MKKKMIKSLIIILPFLLSIKRNIKKWRESLETTLCRNVPQNIFVGN